MSIPGPDIVSDPSSSGQIGVLSDDLMNQIQLALPALHTLGVIIPHIIPVAQLLQRVLIMWDEVRQWKTECRRVMQKLVDIANIVIKFSKSCEGHNLREQDLPDNLREILGSLQRKLDSVEHVLKKCAKTKAAKGFFLRKGLLKKIERCESELADAHQEFQNAFNLVMLNMYLAQIARRRRWKNMFDFIRRLWKGGKRSDG